MGVGRAARASRHMPCRHRIFAYAPTESMTPSHMPLHHFWREPIRSLVSGSGITAAVFVQLRTDCVTRWIFFPLLLGGRVRAVLVGTPCAVPVRTYIIIMSLAERGNVYSTTESQICILRHGAIMSCFFSAKHGTVNRTSKLR